MILVTQIYTSYVMVSPAYPAMVYASSYSLHTSLH